MIKGIPWNLIGPAVSAVVVILGLVFWFIIKLKKLEKSNSSPPKDINSTGKKTLCFTHHGDIAANQKAIEIMAEQFKTAHENNREDHGKIELKIDKLGDKIIQAIDENSIRE